MTSYHNERISAEDSGSNAQTVREQDRYESPDDDNSLSLDDPEIVRCLAWMNRVWSPDCSKSPRLETDLRSAVASNCNARNVDTANGGPHSGETAWGRFLLRRQIGQGSYGVVFLAFDQLVKREVAVKIPQAHVLANADSLKRFLREAEAVANLDHPGIVPVFELGEVQGVAFIVSAYCDGPNLAEWLAERAQPVAPQTAARIVAQIAAALSYAHSRGVLHRDLKPSNILLEQKASASELLFSPRITDFGLAKIVGDSCAATCEGALLGTFRYMSPEQASGRVGDVGVQADIWATGTILYELLAGKPAFATDDVSVLTRIQEQEPTQLSTLGLEIPADLVNICHRCLQKELAHRYRSAEELFADLERFDRGEPVSARPLGAIERIVRWTRRRPALAAMAATLVCVSLVGLIGVMWQWRRANAEAAVARQAAERAEANLAQTREALVDFAWIVQEFALYRRPDDPVPNEVWTKIDEYRQKAATNELSPALQQPVLAARHLVSAIDSAMRADHLAALPDFETGVALWQEIVREHPDNRSYRRALALGLYCQRMSLLRLGRDDQAEDKRQQARQAFAYDEPGDRSAESALLEYAEMAATLGESFMLRARMTESLDAHIEALAAAKEAHEIAPSSRRAQLCAARCASAVGVTRARLHDRKGALEEYAYARDMIDELCAAYPDGEDCHTLRIDLTQAIAENQRNLYNNPRADQAYRRGIEFAELGLAQFPDKVAWSCRLARMCNDFASFRQAQHDHPLAKTNYERANELWKVAQQANRLTGREEVIWGVACYELARIYKSEGRNEEMTASARQGLEILAAASGRVPENRQARLAREKCAALLAAAE